MKRRSARMALITTLGLVGLGGCAATASAAPIELGLCDDAQLTQPFAPWGDQANYKLAPGGDFESGTDGWAFTRGAGLTAGANGGQGVSIPQGATVTSPATCVNAAYPTIRFFARSAGGLLGGLAVLKVDLLYRDGLLGLVPVPAGVVTPSSAWAPTLPMLTLSAVAAALTDGEAPVAVRFTSLTGTWTIDDVFVDPYRRG